MSNSNARMKKAELIDELARAQRRIAELEGNAGRSDTNGGGLPVTVSGESLAKALFDNSSSILFLKDTDLRLLYANRRYEEFHNASPGELNGRQTAEWVPEKYLRAVTQQDQEVLRLKAQDVRELEFPRPDGIIHTVISTKFPIFGPDGEVIALGAINTDITERKEMEAALRESEEKYRNLVEGSLEGIFVMNKDWQPLFVNPRAAEIFGYENPMEILTAETMEILFAPEEVERLRGMKDERIAGGNPTAKYEYQGVCKDGTRIWLLNQSKAVMWNGHPAVQATVVDITEHKAAEAQLRHAVKFDAIGQLTGGISHDFNNLFAIIQGNLELLAERTGDQSDSAGLISPALEATFRGARLTRRLLAFNQNRPVQHVPTDINAHVSGMTELLRRTLGETVEVRTRLMPDCRPVAADADGLDTVLVNLAVNARDAMSGSGGLLTIESRDTDIWTEGVGGLAPGSYVVLSISDNGSGMSPDTAARAFEPLYSTKDVTSGVSGLGLAIVKRFVGQARGHVEIESELGRGTTVRLYLPIWQGAADVIEADNQGEPRSAVGNGELVMVVEDDGDLRALATDLIASLGYRTLAASDGPSALALFEDCGEEDVAVLFSDIVLPNGISGIELAKLVRARFPQTAILLTTGYPEMEDKPPAEIEGFSGVLEKPYPKSELARELRRAITGPGN